MDNIRLNVCLASMVRNLVLAGLILHSTTPLASAQDGEKLDVFVCQESKLWTRPSEEVQQRRLRDRSRQEPYVWVRDFIFYQGKDGEGAEVDIERLSGAWAAKETTRHCNDAWWMEQIEEGRFLELWSFFHEVLSVVRKDNVDTVTVQPTSQGYQFVRFAKSGKDEWESVELVVVTPSGELLETLTEKSGARR